MSWLAAGCPVLSITTPRCVARSSCCLAECTFVCARYYKGCLGTNKILRIYQVRVLGLCDPAGHSTVFCLLPIQLQQCPHGACSSHHLSKIALIWVCLWLSCLWLRSWLHHVLEGWEVFSKAVSCTQSLIQHLT